MDRSKHIRGIGCRGDYPTYADWPETKALLSRIRLLRVELALDGLKRRVFEEESK